MRERKFKVPQNLTEHMGLPSRRSWVMLGLVMCMAGAGHFNRVSISVAGSEAIIDKEAGVEATPASTSRPGISTTQMGTVYSSFLVFYTCCMIPGGWLIDRIGPKWSLALMCLGSALFTFLTGVIGLVWQDPALLLVGLLVVRSLMGVTNAPLHPASARLVADWFPGSATALANGMVTFAACIGMGIVYVCFGLLIDAFGWPVAFLITGGGTLLLALLWMILAEDGPIAEVAKEEASSAETRGLQNSWTLLANPSLLSLTASYAAVGYFQYLFFYWMQFYFENILKFEPSKSRWLSTAMTFTMGLGMLIGGRLADHRRSGGGRHAHRIVPIACLLVSAVLVLIAVLSSNNNLKIALFLLSMAAVGGTEGSYWTQAVALGRTRGGTSGAILNAGGNVGGLLAPIVTPLIAKYFDWQYGLGAASVVCVAGAILWYWVELPADRQPSYQKVTA